MCAIASSRCGYLLDGFRCWVDRYVLWLAWWLCMIMRSIASRYDAMNLAEVRLSRYYVVAESRAMCVVVMQVSSMFDVTAFMIPCLCSASTPLRTRRKLCVVMSGASTITLPRKFVKQICDDRIACRAPSARMFFSKNAGCSDTLKMHSLMILAGTIAGTFPGTFAEIILAPCGYRNGTLVGPLRR